jgi:predicted heme/steroid binding protein
MMKKLLVMFAMLMLVAMVLAGCGGNGAEPEEPGNGEIVENELPEIEEPEAEGETFTLAELAEFDGKDGRPAYVAVDGVVYEVTGSDDWPEGDHMHCGLDAAAGRDLSEVLRQAPARMRALIEARPVVGTLAE